MLRIALLFSLLLPLTTLQAQGQDMDWSAVVAAAWDGYKRHYITCGDACGANSGLVYDPATGYQAVSEGVGYGLLMAVMMRDQPTFDAIYNAAHAQMLDPTTRLFHWRVDNLGTRTGFGSATDAEQDIAAALIFAQQRVARGEWSPHPERPYDARAAELIDAIWTHEVADGRYLKAGNEFGDGQELTNLSYFAPAWYRLFDAFQETDRWNAVIDQGYETLYATPGAARGLAPDWSTAAGAPAFAYCESIGRPLDTCSYEMRYEAIRVPWRVGLDCLWYGEPRACEWSRRTANFLSGRDSGHFARMYDLAGRTVITYRDEAMIGMWLTAAIAAGDVPLRDRLVALLRDSSQQTLASGYFGNTPTFYYNQSLGWFGAALLSGDFAPVG